MRAILNDPALNSDLRKDGVAVSRTFLLLGEIAELITIARSENDNHNLRDVHIDTPYLLSTFNNGYAYKSRIFDRVQKFIGVKMDTLLNNYTPLLINIFEKSPEFSGSVPIHQNPSFSQEPEHKSVSVWIPLMDVDKHNGTVGVLRGSQDMFDGVRPPNMGDVFADMHDQLIHQYFEPLVMKAGQVAVLDDSMVHWSFPNLSGKTRTALQVICVPKEVPLVYFFYDFVTEQKQVRMYHCDKTFFFRFNCHEEPAGLQWVKTFDYEFKVFSPQEFARRMAGRNPNFPAVKEMAL